MAPARLHMGFIDLSGALGRHFGSIGVALNEIVTRLTITRSDCPEVSGVSEVRVAKQLQSICIALNVPDTVHIHVDEAIPEHVGLGSGTQMALAIGMGLSHFYGLSYSVRDIAQLTARGRRSGIGIGVFERGGLVVDGGRGEHTITPPVLSQMAVPENWRFILVFDKRGQGLHGKQEIEAFKALPPFSQIEAARLCYLLLMQGLPAIAERDIAKFGEVITQLQKAVGEHFASAQGGVFTSNEVSEAMSWCEHQGAVALGQTSWGPTGFCAVEGTECAEALCLKAQLEFSGYENLQFMTVSARNSGGEIVGFA
ncbi:MAG: GHMP kinase [Methylicorpusculum sp.]|uniref:beta-ribofuranosylaminobenzene 5'-phosphate synthase family protein n=1 Tax=Methylicorpusculum sp. TaxID=2713644 RepID=UPI00271884CD|nr:beta-ribofuranosylaminobenzene 5'-phosphate synthase family protein [Methylicorpusculum sp.]MDO8938254.1 GHMP kinase [Methylicorpusculum sp.]MDP2203719.1 GHMP kinase [Methylicorpusculum sp.]